MRLGMTTGKDVAVCEGATKVSLPPKAPHNSAAAPLPVITLAMPSAMEFIFCVNTVSWGSGKSLASHGTLVLGQQKPVTMSMRKSLSVVGLHVLRVLCGCCHICSRKKKGGEMHFSQR